MSLYPLRPGAFLRSAALAIALAFAGVPVHAATTPSAAPLVGRTAPNVPLKAIDGRDMSLARARGHYVLLVFSDARSRLLSRTFLAHNAARLGQIRGLSIYHIQVPGQVLMPRAAWLYQARADAAKTVAEARDSVMSIQQDAFDRLDIRFHADFDRQFSDLFDAPRAVVSLVLVDPNGYIAAQERDTEEPAVQRVIRALKEHKLAPGSRAPRPPATELTDGARQAAASRLGVKTPAAYPRESDEDEDEAPPVQEQPPPPGRDEEAAVTGAPPPHGASKKKNRFLY